MRKRESVDNQFGFNITLYEKTAFSKGDRDAVMDVTEYLNTVSQIC